MRCSAEAADIWRCLARKETFEFRRLIFSHFFLEGIYTLLVDSIGRSMGGFGIWIIFKRDLGVLRGPACARPSGSS